MNTFTPEIFLNWLKKVRCILAFKNSGKPPGGQVGPLFLQTSARRRKTLKIRHVILRGDGEAESGLRSPLKSSGSASDFWPFEPNKSRVLLLFDDFIFRAHGRPRSDGGTRQNRPHRWRRAFPA